MRILKSELKVKKLVLQNRLVMPPMATPKSADVGLVTEELCTYYREKSKAVGLVITEHSYVDIVGKAHKGQLSIADDRTISGLTKLTQTIHANGTPVFAQLSHAGGRTSAEVTGFEAVAPSAIELPRVKKGHPTAREMTEAEIHKLIADFAAAAVRAKKAGYDGVEIHSAHCYLLNQFLSPLSNKRADAYNGSTLEGRLKLHLEIVAAVREAVGNDYPIALRLAACDFMEGGITMEDSTAAAVMLERGGVDMLDVSGGFYGYLRPGHTESGYFRDLSRAVKEKVQIPVIVTGGITTAEGAEELLEAGDADLVGVGRAILKDSNWTINAIAEN